MAISKKAKRGLEHAIKVLERGIKNEVKPQTMLRLLEIKSLYDTYFLLEHLRRINRYDLINRILENK